MERKAIMEALTSPYGEFDWHDNYGLFTPLEGADFTAVLLHVNYKDVEPKLVQQINEMLNQEAPPIILFTYGDKFVNVSGLCAEWEKTEFKDNFRCIVSIVNTKLGWTKGYTTKYDNLPMELEYLFNCRYGKLRDVRYGSKIGEAMGSIFDKPCVSLNLPGNVQDIPYLKSLLDHLPACPDYSYTQYINTDTITLAHEKTSGYCGCCGRDRAPLLYYDKLATSVCSACEKKIKKKGPIKLESLFEVRHDLEIERAETRRANSLRQVKQAGMYKCPICQQILHNQSANKYKCACGLECFVVGKRIIEVKELHGKKYAYSYSIRNTGVSKLLGVDPMDNDTSATAICELCGRATTHWRWWNDDRGTPHKVCKDHANTFPYLNNL